MTHQHTRNSDENSGPALVPQSHGGALLAGGMPGNRGGPGRPRSRVRDLSAIEFEKRIPLLGRIADSDDERAADRIRAVDVLGRHGGLQVKGVDRDTVISLVRSLAYAVRAVAPEAAVEILGTWEAIVRDHVPSG